MVGIRYWPEKPRKPGRPRAIPEKLNCSQAYVYKVLKEAGLMVNGVKR